MGYAKHDGIHPLYIFPNGESVSVESVKAIVKAEATERHPARLVVHFGSNDSNWAVIVPVPDGSTLNGYAAMVRNQIDLAANALRNHRLEVASMTLEAARLNAGLKPEEATT